MIVECYWSGNFTITIGGRFPNLESNFPKAVSTWSLIHRDRRMPDVATYVMSTTLVTVGSARD